MFNLPAAFAHTLKSGLLLDEVMHGVVAVPFGLFLWYQTKSIKSILIFYLAVYLIDLDHLIDYWLYVGVKLDALEFVELDFFAKKATAILIFHAWEWVIIYFGIFFRRLGWRSYLTAIFWGILAHLTWDIHNFWTVEFYSIIYRAVNGFRF